MNQNLKKFLIYLILISIFTIHFVLVLYNFPLKMVFSGFPVASIDYDTHYAQTVRVTIALENFGKPWVWDPRFNAGFPEGTIFDGDNKAHELFAFLLYKAKISLPIAFNLFVFLGHLLPPFVFFLACRLMRGSIYAQSTAAFLGSMIWNFDAMVRWTWWVGMISYAIASTIAILPIAFYFRFANTKRLIHILFAGIFLSLVHLVHPLLFLVLFIPMVTIYFMNLKKFSLREHLATFGMCIFTILVNLYWILLCIKFLGYVTGSEVFGRANWWFIITDYFGIVGDTAEQGLVAMRTGWRILVITLSAIGIYDWYKRRDSRFLPFTLVLIWLLFISYFGRYLPIIKHIQPYRYIVPLSSFAIIPASISAEKMVTGILTEKLKWEYAKILVVLFTVALPHLARDVIYFIPQLKPQIVRPEPGLPNISDTLGFGSIGWPDQQEYRHGLGRSDYFEVRKWVLQHDDGSGRFLVQWWILGEFLGWSTNAQIIGGFRYINLKHGFANIFRTYYYEPPPADYFQKYIKRYAIKYLITSGAMTAIEVHKDILKGIDFIPPSHRIYLLDSEPSWFEKGRGKVKVALNKIEVSNAEGDEIILKYHYLEDFICKPNCKVEKYPIPNDPVGFIKVRNPPKNFVIENGY